MDFLKKIGGRALQYLKMLTLWDIKSYLSRQHLIRIGVITLLNLWNSVAKILAPASLAKAVELIATSKKHETIGLMELQPQDFLYIALVLSVWVKSEIYLKNFLVRNIESVVVENHVMKIIETSHEMKLQSHIEQRSQIIKLLTDVINIQSKLSTEVVNVIYQVTFDIVIGTSIIWKQYGNLIGAEFLLYSAIDILVLTHLIEYLTAQSKNFNKMNASFQKFINREFEILGFEETVRILNHEQLEIDLSRKNLTQYLLANNKYKLSEDFASVMKLIPYLIANLIPISFIFKDSITIGDLDDFVFLLGYLNLFGGNILNLTQSIKSGKRAVISIEQLQSFILEHTATRVYQTNRPLIERPIMHYNTSPEIIFDNVHFTYPKQSVATLKGLSFRIRSGMSVGIIGHSNAGKSTIIRLLFGLYHQEQGSIKIGGEDIRDISRKTLGEIFCCVPQTIELFREKSLKYNILYGSSNDSVIKNYLAGNESSKEKQTTDYEAINLCQDNNEDEISQANLQFAQIMRKVKLEALVDSADTVDSALAMSGGQRQRANIARALMRNSSIFIFDEITSSLDDNTKQKVLKNVRKICNGKTRIMITHDLSTIEDVDEVIVLKNGQIIDQGAPGCVLGRN